MLPANCKPVSDLLAHVSTAWKADGMKEHSVVALAAILSSLPPREPADPQVVPLAEPENTRTGGEKDEEKKGEEEEEEKKEEGAN